jgi:ABC-type multidrug transport system fused ATPase/permease subunit
MDFWKLLFSFIPRYKWHIISYVLLIILSSIFSIFSFATIIPLLQLLFGISEIKMTYVDISTITSFKNFLNYIENNALFFLQEQISTKGSVSALFIIALFVIITSASSNLISYLAYYVRIPIRTGIARDLRNKAYNTILYMKLGTFSLEKRGDFISRMTSDIDEVDSGIGTAMDMLIKEPIKIILYVITLLGISISLTLEALGLLVVSCFFIALAGSVMKRLAREGQECRSKILSRFEETLEKIRLIRLFGLGEFFDNDFICLSDKAMHIFNKTNRLYSIAWPLADFLLSSSIAILMLLGGALILENTYSLSAEKFIYFLVIFFSIIPPIRNITKSTYGIRKAMASVERMNYIYSQEKENEETYSNTADGNFKKGDIVFNDVSFGYTSTNLVVNDINITIPLNRFTIIKGNVGTGKTTLVNLLLKLYTPTKGSISIGEYDIQNLPSHYLRSMITYVPQDSELFNASIIENIRLGRLDESIHKIKEYAKIVGINDYIEDLPEGYNTIVGDNGINFSSGQKQALVLVRAMLRDTDILVLDESTNCMDSSLENNFFRNLRSIYPNKTIILITHDEHLYRFADKIITV